MEQSKCENALKIKQLSLDKSERDRYFASKNGSDNISFIENILLAILFSKGLTTSINPLEILRVFFLARKIFVEQPKMLELEGPIKICGDIHGQYGDLVRLFNACGFPPETNYLFLGDYVDRGKHSMEVLLICLAYKVRYPNNFFMLRGNHEERSLNSTFGFKDEVFRRMSVDGEEVYRDAIDMMNWMPITALIGTRILCMHGGISPRLNSLDDLRNLRPVENQDECLEMHLMWADPSDALGYQLSSRGGFCYTFSPDVLNASLKKLGVDMIIRGHQVVQDGFQFNANRKCVTVFSAPLYVGQFANSSAVCVVSKDLEISFEQLNPEILQRPKPNNQ